MIYKKYLEPTDWYVLTTPIKYSYPAHKKLRFPSKIIVKFNCWSCVLECSKDKINVKCIYDNPEQNYNVIELLMTIDNNESFKIDKTCLNDIMVSGVIEPLLSAEVTHALNIKNMREDFYVQ